MFTKKVFLKVVLPVVVVVLLLIAVFFTVPFFAKADRLESAVGSVLRFPYQDAEDLRTGNLEQLGNLRANIGDYFSTRYSDVMTENCAEALVDEVMQWLTWCWQEEYRSEMIDFTSEQTGSDYGRFDCSIQVVKNDGSVTKTLPMGGRFQLAEDGRVSFLEFDKPELLAFAGLYYEYFPLE